MKQLVTYLSIFAGGCAIGVFASRLYFEKKYKDIADSEIESVKEVYRRKTIALDGERKKEDNKENLVANEKEQIGSVIFKPENMESMALKYHTISNDILSNPESPTEEDYKPYFIDVDTFDDINEGYAKREYIYYMDDSTLADASIEAAATQTDIEEEVINASDTVGTDNLEMFETMDEEVCYIRNESRKEDYEITKIFGSYSAIVGDDY